MCRLPMICILVEGGPNSISTCVATIRNGIFPSFSLSCSFVVFFHILLLFPIPSILSFFSFVICSELKKVATGLISGGNCLIYISNRWSGLMFTVTFTVTPGNPVLVLQGSGRSADIIAKAYSYSTCAVIYEGHKETKQRTLPDEYWVCIFTFCFTY